MRSRRRGVHRAMLRIVLGAAVMLRASAASGQAVPLPPPLSAEEETALLRQSSAQEWRGDLEAAERILVGILQRNPTSSGALFSLERILRSRGRIGEVLPAADAFLAAAPGASAPRYLKLRVLVEIDSVAALEAEARAWFAAEPGSPDPYREVARLYQRSLGDSAALGVLERGRRALGGEATLAVDLGEARARMGDVRGAMAEWAAALGAPGADVDGIVRRVERLVRDQPADAQGGEGRGGAVPDAERIRPVLAALTQVDAPVASRLAAVGLALRLGLAEAALRTATEGLRGLPAAEQTGYLREVARASDAVGAAEVSLWALGTLRTSAPAAPADPGSEVRLAAAALAAGDTAEAVAAQLRLVRGLDTGSDARRRALGDLLRVEAAWSGVGADGLLARLRGIVAEFPDAPELDLLTARTAAALATRGDPEGALGLVDAAPGPRARAERAWLLLAAGDLAEGREALTGALAGLEPAEATDAIQLLVLLERATPPAARVLAHASATARHGEPAEGALELEQVLDAAAPADQPALAFGAARLWLEAGDTARALTHLMHIAEGHPGAPEASEAILVRARLLAASDGTRPEAEALLTDLIVGRPGAAVVPDARRLLDELRRGGER